MIRFAAAAFAIFALAAPALAVEFRANDQGYIEFTMPSGNIGCFYTPAGGTDIYETSDGGAELSCDRVEPSLCARDAGRSGQGRTLSPMWAMLPAAGRTTYFEYGEVWSEGPFSCISSTTGLTCTRGTHGFSMSRKA